MKVREKSEKMQDLSARTPGFSEDKESKCRREVPKVPSKVWNKAGQLEVVYSELLEVRECREATLKVYELNQSGSKSQRSMRIRNRLTNGRKPRRYDLQRSLGH